MSDGLPYKANQGKAAALKWGRPFEVGQTPWSARDPQVPLFLSGLARLCRFA